jgi:hypothetical protein
MTVKRPFFRCVRPGVDGEYLEGGRWMYVRHPLYAPDAHHYIRAFLILQEDLQRLFEFIEPADANEAAYSFRALELLLRACGEVEANCRAILDANGYVPGKWPTMTDYKKLDSTHRLSSYRVRLPVWRGDHSVRTPFAGWNGKTGLLSWYTAHHGGKHNRHEEFPGANLANVVDAVAAVVVLLAAQFCLDDFGPSHLELSFGPTEYDTAIGGYFGVAFPNDFPVIDRYDFDWQTLKEESQPFQRLTF